MFVFQRHFDLACKYDLPICFHFHACNTHVIEMIKANKYKFKSALAHQISCTKKTMLELVKLGIYIGVSIKSMKT